MGIERDGDKRKLSIPVTRANNTFSGRFEGQVPGTFGTYFDGILLSSYLDYLGAATGGKLQLVPEPASMALLGLGLLMLAGTRRRSAK